MRRRDFLRTAALASLAPACWRLARPAAAEGPLSAAAAAMLERAWEGLDPARVIDCHTHIVGLGAGGSGAWVNPDVQRWLAHPIKYARFSIYRSAAGVEDLENADKQYVDTLVQRIRGQPRHGRHLALAFDWAHGEDGQPDPAASDFFTPNDYVLRLAREFPDCFVPAASIHPYRADAVEELDRVAQAGAAAVKWLPNSQRIDPASARCDKFYARMAGLGMPLLTHAGEERAVDAEGAQELGNPLRLRRALDAGVKVIVAHCASLGEAMDLDAPEKPQVDCTALLLRLMDEPRHRERLFADVSALGQSNRCAKLATVLARADLHARMVNGSDYPLCAIDVLVRTGKLESLGYLSEEEGDLLDEIDTHNPLAFDFALKRTVRGEGGARFPASVFMPPPGLLRGV